MVLVKEPGSRYVGHVTPESGSSANILKAILEFFEKEDVDLGDLLAVGSDGTAVNTGSNMGIIRQMEVHLKKTLTVVNLFAPFQ